MNFSIDQGVAVSPEVAMAAYGNPDFYDGREPRDNISVLEVVSHEDTGSRVLIQVRFKFTGSVSGAVRRIIDPAKMSWITKTEILVDEQRSSFEVLPDNYPDRLTCTGNYHFKEGPDGPTSAVVNVEGHLKVHVPFVGGTVERVIVKGLQSYIDAEVTSIPDLDQG
jgi:Protein of unknown function (DUF2505)